MRRKPTSGSNNNGYNNQQRRPRYPSNGGGDRPHNNGGGHNRPRKNYAANREKYLAQARDALASGDRVLAENYFQHADHCYRMMVEEGINNPRQHFSAPQPGYEQGQEAGNEQAGEQGNESQHSDHSEEHIPENTNVLPAFLTVPFGSPAPAEPPAVQNWEERDA